jgi:hypothetical protein
MDEQTRKIKNHLDKITIAVGELNRLLPLEQNRVGGELHQIEILQRILYAKYVTIEIRATDSENDDQR